jgi:CHAT domain-containing protein
LTLSVGAAFAQAPDDKALATELLAQADASARERWLEAHPAQLTSGLGREVAAQARVLYLASRFAPAHDAFSLALRIGASAADPETRIRALEGLGGVERFQGRPQEALPILERAKAEAEAVADQAAIGRILGGMGSARRTLGEYGGALALFQRQLAIFEALGDAKGQGQALSNIGIALGTLGRYAEARDALARSIALTEAGGDAQAVSGFYNNLSICHRHLGDYTAALEALDHSLRLIEASGNRTTLPNTLQSIGAVYAHQGANLQALEQIRRAYAIASELGQKEAMAVGLNDEGMVLLDLERAQDAQVSLDRALALAEEIHQSSVITSASLGLAEVHWRRGERPRALELLGHGLETAERTQELPLVIRAQRLIATLRLEDGQAAEALELAGRAAQQARRYGLSEELWPALLTMGRAEGARGHGELAEQALREAVDVVEELRAHAVGPDSDRAAFLIPHAAPYQELVGLLVEGGRPWEALAVAERSKGRALLDALAGGRTAIAAALSVDERAEERRLEADVLTTNSELRALLLKEKPEAARKMQLESERDSRRRALEDFRTRQYAAHPELRVLRGESRLLTREDARDLLAGGRTTLLEYALAGRNAYLFALSAGASGEAALSVQRLALESGELVRLAGDFRGRLASRDLELAAPAARLYDVLVAPARDVLRQARHVVVVPDGSLWELPFQALRSTAGRYFIEDTAISYAPSLTVLRDMRAHRGAHVAPAGALLAIGNPALGGGARRRSPSALMSDPLQPLPETETQVREIASLYDARTVAVRVGGEARESWLKAMASQYRILHLATHGVLDDASPLYSELVLAAPAAGDSDDGLLEAREILDLDLNADLAVLSACETGRGRAGAGEGLIGMTWAFFVAGCPTTVASQWKVDAASTSRLMLAFHRELRSGRTAAEALRLAALSQLRRRDERHPFYWAGFVAMGDADSF